MPNARPNPLDPNSANTRRFPRLAVRNRSPVTVSEGAQSSGENNEALQSPLNLEATRTGASHSREASSQSLQPEYRHSRQKSKASKISEQPHGRQATKKKSAGVLGFLTLKEPSTSALEEFAEQERRKLAQKNLKSDGVTLLGVSSQRLPDHVPKVNSKWNGLPDSAKRKLDKGREKEKAMRGSVTSFASNGSGDAPRRSHGSLSSKRCPRQSQDKSDLVSREASVAFNDRHDSAVSSVTQPALRHTQGELSNDVRAQTALHPPTPAATFRLDSQDNAFEFDLPDVPNLQERDYSSGSVTSPEASSRTPSSDAVSPGLYCSACSQSPALLVSTSSRRDGDCRTVEGEQVITQSSGSDRPSPPMMLSAKGSGRSLSPQVGTIMPSIEETSDIARADSRIASPEPALVRNFSRPSRVSVTPTVSATRSDPLSNRKVSPAAAVKRTEKNEVLPWEMFEPPSQSAMKPKSTPASSKLERFSKLGRK